MKEANDHSRVSPEGKAMGEFMARVTAPIIASLAQEGEPGECCKTCAFRLGTVPNGCVQTQLDALKCVMEGIPFFCRQRENGKITNVCHGWFAARQAPGVKGKCIPMAWDLSPSDEE